MLIGNHRIDLQGDWMYKVGEVFPPQIETSAPAQYTPTALYNAMIAPFISYDLKGIIWYQGESNVGKPEVYERLLPALATDWRRQFKQPDLPFLYVQLPGFQDRTFLPAESAMAVLREGQLKSLSIPKSAMVVTLDLGEWNDIHPLSKNLLGNDSLSPLGKSPMEKPSSLQDPCMMLRKSKASGFVFVFEKQVEAWRLINQTKTN